MQTTQQKLASKEWVLELPHDKKVVQLKSARPHQAGFIVQLESVDDRDVASSLTGAKVWVERDTLPPLDEEEFYWVDLIGFEVQNQADALLGCVERFYSNGAHDVVCLKGDKARQLPWVMGDTILSVDEEARLIRVDWPENV